MDEISIEAKLSMTKIPQVLLAVSLTAFAVGSVAVLGNPGIPVGWTVAMPLGAVCLGLFLVTFLLQREAALFDEEERARLELADRYATKPAKASPSVVSLNWVELFFVCLCAH